MKVIAIGSLPRPVSEEQRQRIMPREVPHTLQLYLDGLIEQFWFRQDKPGPIFLMNVDSLDHAKAVVGAMPLVEEGLADYEYLPVGPLMPLGRLIQGQ
jgi:hypothetical protein